MSGFRERIHQTAKRHDSWLCVGLDPDPAKLPRAEDVRNFLLDIVDRTRDLVCAYKPNSAFYEALGDEGHDVLLDVCAHASRYAPVILDAKRADIGNTARAYAKWAFDILQADAITVAPYMGRDSIEPFFERPERGCFVLARTSNPGAADLQDARLASGELLYERTVKLARTWNVRGNLGVVAGATAPDELRRIRELAGGDMMILIPGVGAQGGSPEHAMRFGANATGDNAIVNSSRAILYAPDPAKAAADLRAELNKHRAA
ncbi:MAG: orotidine-5-phosphate decarboxylase [Thermoplasmata archaeon]|jgi:orotidine 5'-phosphate decarboxylase subfamily 2|nr:orotidine-5-phosphate decarboxylase [Thermoplasmata archaeon]